MEKSLTGLFGSGPEADAKTARAQDFVKRYAEVHRIRGSRQMRPWAISTNCSATPIRSK